MRTRRVRLGLAVAALAVAAFGSSGAGAAPASRVSGARSAGAALSSAITYQGQLTLDGTPVTATCDFQFILYDSATGGSQVGPTVPVGGQGVAQGVFMASLDFGTTAFVGDARWLETLVRCPAGSGS